MIKGVGSLFLQELEAIGAPPATDDQAIETMHNA
jgi:hypothetical protein